DALARTKSLAPIGHGQNYYGGVAGRICRRGSGQTASWLQERDGRLVRLDRAGNDHSRAVRLLVSWLLPRDSLLAELVHRAGRPGLRTLAVCASRAPFQSGGALRRPFSTEAAVASRPALSPLSDCVRDFPLFP